MTWDTWEYKEWEKEGELEIWYIGLMYREDEIPLVLKKYTNKHTATLTRPFHCPTPPHILSAVHRGKTLLTESDVYNWERERWCCRSSNEMPADSWLFLVRQCVHLIKCVRYKPHTDYILSVHVHMGLYAYKPHSLTHPHVYLALTTGAWTEYRDKCVNKLLCWLGTVVLHSSQHWLTYFSQVQFGHVFMWITAFVFFREVGAICKTDLL